MSNEPFSPYCYQQLVKDRFLAGENIILQAPTGAGKTDASLLPGFEGFDRSAKNTHFLSEYPQRIVYNLPMRALANEMMQKYAQRAQDRRWPIYWHPTIQTGESPDDPLYGVCLTNVQRGATFCLSTSIKLVLPEKIINALMDSVRSMTIRYNLVTYKVRQNRGFYAVNAYR